VTRRLLILIAIAALVFWTAAGITLSESALRVPRRTPPIRPGAVHITAADGVTMRGSFVRAIGSPDCVIVLHGIADSRALGFASMFLDAGYSVLAPDSRGHGVSGGELTTFGVLERHDVLRWADWMRTQGCRRIFGLGESLGGAILIQAAAEQPVFSAIAAECAYSDLPSIAQYRTAQVLGGSTLLARTILVPALIYSRLRHGVDLRAASPVEAARRVKIPLLLIHGTADVNTPPEHSKAIAAAAPRATLWLVPGAIHTGASAKAPAEFRTRVLEHFR
jgi:fermentation-respiration switch protein FrsA (DUF1100 family)